MKGVLAKELRVIPRSERNSDLAAARGRTNTSGTGVIGGVRSFIKRYKTKKEDRIS
jgi:hypothetical protein